MAKGLEPDECYYVQHEAAVRGDNEVDLSSSLAFPMLSLSDLQRFVQMFRDGGKNDTSILRAFREWVRETLSRGQG